MIIIRSIAENTHIKRVPIKLHQDSKEQELDISLDCCCYQVQKILAFVEQTVKVEFEEFGFAWSSNEEQKQHDEGINDVEEQDQRRVLQFVHFKQHFVVELIEVLNMGMGHKLLVINKGCMDVLKRLVNLVKVGDQCWQSHCDYYGW